VYGPHAHNCHSLDRWHSGACTRCSRWCLTGRAWGGWRQWSEGRGKMGARDKGRGRQLVVVDQQQSKDFWLGNVVILSRLHLASPPPRLHLASPPPCLHLASPPDRPPRLITSPAPPLHHDGSPPPPPCHFFDGGLTDGSYIGIEFGPSLPTKVPRGGPLGKTRLGKEDIWINAVLWV
jgi:hypothetical protein